MTLASIFTAAFDFLFGVIPSRSTLKSATFEDATIAILVIVCATQITALNMPNGMNSSVELLLNALGGLLCIASYVYFATMILNKTAVEKFTYAEVLTMDIVTTGGMTVVTTVLGYLMSIAQPLQALALFVVFIVFSVYAFVLMLQGMSAIAGITKWRAFGISVVAVLPGALLYLILFLIFGFYGLI